MRRALNIARRVNGSNGSNGSNVRQALNIERRDDFLEIVQNQLNGSNGSNGLAVLNGSNGSNRLSASSVAMISSKPCRINNLRRAYAMPPSR